MRFGAMASEARNNGSANLKEPCAAERLLEAATASSRPLVVCNALATEQWCELEENKVEGFAQSDKSE